MKRRLSILLIAALLVGALPTIARAETYVICLNYSEFNHPWWKIINGVITESGTLRSSSNAPNRVDAQIVFDPPVRVSSVEWQQWHAQATTAGGAIPLVRHETRVQLLKTYDPVVDASNDIFAPAIRTTITTLMDTWTSEYAFWGDGQQFELQTALNIGSSVNITDLSVPVEIRNVRVCVYAEPGAGLTPTPTPEIPTATLETYTPVPTNTPNPTITRTPTSQPTETRTPTPTNTFIPGVTPTNTLRPGASYTPTITNTPFATLTPYGTPAPSNTPTSTGSATYTPSPTITLLPTLTPGGSGGGGLIIGTLPAIPSPSNGTVSKAFWATIPPPDKCAGPFNGCGALPWPIPPFPTFQSPTPLPGLAIQATATVLRSPTPAPAVTVTALTGTPNGTQVPSSLSTIEGNFQGQISTMIANSTPSAAIAINSTPVTVTSFIDEVSGGAQTFVGYAKGIGMLSGSRLGDLLLFLLLCVLFVALIKFLIFFVPLVLRFINFVVQVIQAIPFL